MQVSVDETMMDVLPERHRFPYCIVWTPIPIITWLIPFVGHMGIGTSRGIIRDFAGSYFVSEDDMAFGWPTLYWQLDPNMVEGGAEAWDRAVAYASEEYKSHVHNLICDSCHSHVAMALNEMKYGRKKNYNTARLIIAIMLKGKYVGIGGFITQWLPFTIMLLLIATVIIISRG